MQDIKVGEQVRVTSDTVSHNVGRTGRVVELDDPTCVYPYLVAFDDTRSGEDWVCRVEKLDMEDVVKVGDYVEITKDREWTSEDVGRRGHVTRIDAGDDLRYRVKLEGDGNDVWFMDVRKVTPEAPSSRVALVGKARALLADTPHTAADIIRLAEFLAAE